MYYTVTKYSGHLRPLEKCRKKISQGHVSEFVRCSRVSQRKRPSLGLCLESLLSYTVIVPNHQLVVRSHWQTNCSMPSRVSSLGFSSLSRLAKDLRIHTLACSILSSKLVSLLLRKYPCYQPLLRHEMLVVRLSWLIQVLLHLVATWLYGELLIQSQNWYLGTYLDSVWHQCLQNGSNVP